MDAIDINDFKLRDYQIPIWDAIAKQGYRKVLAILPRRSGKDICAFNLCIHQAMAKTCSILYALPTFQQGRRVIWDCITTDGKKLLDYIPKEVIKNINHSEMKICFKNDSQIQIIGADSYDTSIVGRNPYAIIFSEWSRCNPKAYDFARPILANNGGWILMITTPYSRNHCYQLFNVASNLKDWFVYIKKTSDIKHIPAEILELEKAQMSAELYAQEYECSFSRGIEGSIYGRLVDQIRENNQISHVPWDPSMLTYTAWDIGVRDLCVILFFQISSEGNSIRIIDCYASSGMGLDHYVKTIREKPYLYGTHFGPHDLAVREFGDGAISRFEKAAQLGLDFEVLPQVRIENAIENVMTHFPRFVIDERRCKRLVEAMEFYHREWNDDKQCYSDKPVHDWSSNFCFTGDTLVLTRNGMRQIMLIEDNDEVLTLQGWYKCRKAQKTRINANIVEVVFVDGTTVKCTPDHLFLTENGWKSSESLTNYIKIQSSLMQGLNILMGICTEFIQMKNTFQKVDLSCIETYGDSLLEKYQKIVKYTTEIIVPLTTAYTILNAYQEQTIAKHITNQLIEFLAKKLEIEQQSGMDQRQEKYGIRDMLNGQLIGQYGEENREIVCIAIKSSAALLEKMGIPRNTVIPIVKQCIIESVKTLPDHEDVWDISVPGVGHFSLANGAIVHNCDSVKYLCQAIPLCKQGLTAEKFDQIKKEALYGGRTMLNPLFVESNPWDRFVR